MSFFLQGIKNLIGFNKEMLDHFQFDVALLRQNKKTKKVVQE